MTAALTALTAVQTALLTPTKVIVRRSRLPVRSRPGKQIPVRRENMDRQQRLQLARDPTTPVVLSADLQEQLVALMADAITAVHEQDGDEDDEHSDVQPQD